MDSKRIQAAVGGSLHRFAVGNATTPNFQTLFSLMQCTLDLFAVIAWLRRLEIFRNVVVESKEGDLIHPAIILFFRSTPSMIPYIHH